MRSGACLFLIPSPIWIGCYVHIYPFLIETSATGWNKVGSDFQTNFLYIGFFVFCCSVYLFARWFFFLSSFILVREIAMQKLLPSNKFLLMCNLIIMNLLLCSFICNSLFVCVYLSELLLICAYNINTVRIYVFHCVSNFSDFPFLRSLFLSLSSSVPFVVRLFRELKIA